MAPPTANMIEVQVSQTATIIDPETGITHASGSKVQIPADKFGQPLSRHWRRKVAAGDCKPTDKPAPAGKAAKPKA